MKKYNVEKSEDEWKNQLGEDKYRILRKKGTEAPHTGKYNIHFDNGEYHCAACYQNLWSIRNCLQR